MFSRIKLWLNHTKIMLLPILVVGMERMFVCIRSECKVQEAVQKIGIDHYY